MPSSTQGYTRDELITEALDLLGRTGDSTMQTRLENNFNFIQQRLWMLHDWTWAHKNGVEDNLTITLSTNTTQYSLPIGIRTGDVERIYSQETSNEKVLSKVSTRDIRAKDPGQRDTGFPTVWSPVDKSKILVYPKPTATENSKVLYVDGRMIPTFITVGSSYPDTPPEYQHLLLQMLVVFGMERDHDPLRDKELVVFKDMLREAVTQDMRYLESNLRWKDADEEYLPVGTIPDRADVMWNKF